MNTLTEEQIELISQRVNNSTIASLEMREDLIDHFCCAIEEEMEKGLSFQQAYDKAYLNSCPDGFDEIQQETIFLLTFKKIKAMRRLMYVSGYLSIIGITAGLLMKIAHISGGQIVLLLTAAILVFLFLPALLFNQYKRELTQSIGTKLKYIFGFLGTLLLISAGLSKIAHWQGSTMLFITAIVIINFAFFPLLFFKMYRKTSKQ